MKLFPDIRGKQRYFAEKVRSKEIRRLVLTGFSDIETYHLIEKMPEDDPFLAGLFEKFYPLIVPGSGNKQIWVDGVLWEEELDA